MIPNSPEEVIARRQQKWVRYLLTTTEAKATKQGVPFELTHADIAIPARCPVTDLELKRCDKPRQPEAATVESLDKTKGYVPGNIRVVSFLATTENYKSKQTGQRTCPGCQAIKPLTEFYGHGKHPTSAGYCKTCKNQRNHADPVKVAIWDHKKYENNREEILAKNRRFRLEHPERVREWKKKCTPEMHLLHAATARAKKRGVPCTITLADIVIPEFCPALGIRLEKGDGKISRGSPSLDCFNPELGYVPGNVYVISHKANTMKSNANTEEVRRLAEWMKSVQQTPSERGEGRSPLPIST